MTEKVNNLPAFPGTRNIPSSIPNGPIYDISYEGMTLRDYFAIRFAQAYISSGQSSSAEESYKKADMMLAEREKYDVKEI